MTHSSFTFFSALVLSLFLFSCEQEAYEKGDGKYSLLQAELADMHIDSKGQADFFLTDADERLTVDNAFTSKWMTKTDSTYRALVYFSRNGEKAEVTSANRVGVVVPKKLKANETMKTDPVRFESVWLSASRRYLNVSLYLMSGSTDDDKAVHLLGCVADTLMVNGDSTRTAYTTLYHDQGGLPEYYSQRTFLSIPLSDLPADSLTLTINTYNGIFKRTFYIK